MQTKEHVDHAAYQAEIESWRQRMEASLRAERSWLTLVGLFWLEEGSSRFGISEDNEIVLPGNSTPEHAGSFTLGEGTVTLHATSDAVTLDGAPVRAAVLRSDADAQPDLVAIGDLTMLVIRRGQRYGIRVWDRSNPARAAFQGRRWYPVRESYRLTAQFVEHDPPRTLAVPNIMGEIEQRLSPGYAVFALDGREYSLDAVTEGDELFFIFRDQTATDSTYPAGRFLKSAFPRNGQITLDFNRAYSPPCAFTAYATCPLPPPRNQLPLRIEAGELYDHSHG